MGTSHQCFPHDITNWIQTQHHKALISQSQSWGLKSRSTARVILEQVLIPISHYSRYVLQLEVLLSDRDATHLPRYGVSFTLQAL